MSQIDYEVPSRAVEVTSRIAAAKHFMPRAAGIAARSLVVLAGNLAEKPAGRQALPENDIDALLDLANRADQFTYRGDSRAARDDFDGSGLVSESTDYELARAAYSLKGLQRGLLASKITTSLAKHPERVQQARDLTRDSGMVFAAIYSTLRDKGNLYRISPPAVTHNMQIDLETAMQIAQNGLGQTV